MTTTIRPWLDSALLQSAAECYFHEIDITSEDQVKAKLLEGANNAQKQGRNPAVAANPAPFRVAA